MKNFNYTTFSEVEFPAFTICGQGMNTDVLQAGFFKEFFNYLENEGLPHDLTPLVSAQIVDVVRYVKLYY